MNVAGIAFTTFLLTVVAGSAVAQRAPGLDHGASMSPMLDYAYCKGWSEAKEEADLKLRSLPEVLQDEALWKVFVQTVQIGPCPLQGMQPTPAPPKSPPAARRNRGPGRRPR